jgi:integrase
MARPKKQPPKLKEWPKIRERYHSDGVTIKSFMVDSGTRIDGKRIQKCHLTKEAAEAHAESIRILYSNAGHSGFKITDSNREDAKAAIDKLTKAGLEGTRLEDVVDFFLLHNRPPSGLITLSKLRDNFIERSRGLVRDVTLKDTEARLKQFVNYIGGEISVTALTKTRLKEYIYRKGVKWQHQRNDYAALNKLFEYALRPDRYEGRKTRRDAAINGWIALNPLTEIQKPSKPADEHDNEPAILSLDEAASLLRAAYETRLPPDKSRDPSKIGFLGEIALELFCGVRPDSEIPHLHWSDIKIKADQGTLNIRRSKSKAGKRNIKLPEVALQWLKLCPKQTGPIHEPKNYRRRWDRFKELAGIKTWKQDILRHTAASVHFALADGNADAVCKFIGHADSGATFFDHYRAIMDEDLAARFRALTPEAVLSSPDNIVSITAPEEATTDKKAQKHATPRKARR